MINQIQNYNNNYYVTAPTTSSSVDPLINFISQVSNHSSSALGGSPDPLYNVIAGSYDPYLSYATKTSRGIVNTSLNDFLNSKAGELALSSTPSYLTSYENNLNSNISYIPQSSYFNPTSSLYDPHILTHNPYVTNNITANPNLTSFGSSEFADPNSPNYDPDLTNTANPYSPNYVPTNVASTASTLPGAYSASIYADPSSAFYDPTLTNPLNPFHI